MTRDSFRSRTVIAHRACGFSHEAAIPVIGMQPVADLDLPWHFRMMIKTAVTDNRVLATRDHGKLRWNAAAIPAHNFLDESDRLFGFGKTPNEKRMKSGLANKSAMAFTSSSRKERRIRRE